MLTNNMYAINQYIISKLHEPYRTIISYLQENCLIDINKSLSSYTKSISLRNI